MLRTATAALAIVLAISPIGFSAFSITQNDATAGATLRPGMLMPGKTRTFGSGGEFRVCRVDPRSHVRVQLADRHLDRVCRGAKTMCPGHWHHDELQERKPGAGDDLRLRRLGRAARPRPRAYLTALQLPRRASTPKVQHLAPSRVAVALRQSMLLRRARRATGVRNVWHPASFASLDISHTSN
jgi:hypothetical protein